MSIRDHKKEVKRWLGSPDGTKVWSKEDGYEWVLVNDPSWFSERTYVVDDRHSELRKQWIDRDKPLIQFKDEYGNWNDVKTPLWRLNGEYRIKPNEWETPEGEDPIEYHAKRLNSDCWEPVWENVNQAKFYIVQDFKNKRFDYSYTYHSKSKNVTYMDLDAARKIIEALNNGYLTLDF